MNNLGNKKTMASNIKYYMERKGVSSADVCKALDVPESTFSYWLNCKTYPRIDKIEKMANYFGISKSDLVEEQKKPTGEETGGLSDEELELIKMFRMVKPDERSLVLSMIRVALSIQK